MPRRLAPFAFPLVAFFLVVGLLACVTNPATGRRQLIVVSSDEEVQMGQQAVPGILAEFGAYADPRLSSWVEGIGRELVKTTERPDLPYRFEVLDSPVVNAFALPGGPVFVTRGLIAHANDQAELAGVVGHEIGHVVARHSAEQVSRSQLLGLGLGVAGVVRPELQRFGQLIGTGAQLLLLGYSRDAEREADGLGVRYIARASYDPLGMPRFMRVLDRLSQASGAALPGWLATHPDPGERAATTERLAREAKVTNGRTLRENLLQHVDGVVFGDDPRQGFQRGTTFHHPGLRFRFDAPEGWKTINTQRVVATLDDPKQPTAQFALRIVPKDAGGDLAPAAFAVRAADKNPDVVFDGRAGTINGKSAWTGTVRVPTEGGGSQTILAAWVAHGGALYQLTGHWAGDGASARGALERTLRSFRDEADAAVLDVKPVALRVARPESATTVAAFCAARKDLGAPCREVAQINQLAESARVERGTALKYPVRQSAIYP